MGQNISEFESKSTDFDIPNNDTHTDKDLIYLSPTNLFNDKQIIEFKNDFIKNLRIYLFSSTQSSSWNQLNNEFTDTFLANTMANIKEQMEKTKEEQTARLKFLSQLETTIKAKLAANDKSLLSIFEQPQDQDQLSFFAIQSLISILLILIKSAEKNDPTIIEQILLLTRQLTQQLPVRSLSSTNQMLFKSIEPLTNYIIQLSINSLYTTQTIEILLHFALAKGSFKEILNLLKNLIFNTTNEFHLQDLCRKMNNHISKYVENNQDFQSTSFDYLKTRQIFPTTDLTQNSFTGQLISSIIFSYLDIEIKLNSEASDSIALEVHLQTFETLFDLIKQLTSSTTNPPLAHVLSICLRLFRVHLQLTSTIKLTLFSEVQLQTWSAFFTNMISKPFAEKIIRESSKVLINILNFQELSFDKKLEFIQKTQNTILLKELFIELNKNEFLTSWIESLRHDTHQLTGLYALIDISFSKSNSSIDSILSLFQFHLLSILIDQCEKKTVDQNLSHLIARYLTYLLQKHFQSKSVMTDQLQSIFIGIALLTDTNVFLYDAIQSIFLSILPLLIDFYFSNFKSDFLLCLIGRISQLLIIGSSPDSLELKHSNQLNKQTIFTGGYILDKTDELFQTNLAKSVELKFEDEFNDDKTFLFSIFNQTDSGAKLLSKLRSVNKAKQRFIQKSIEEQVNSAIACLFAVYLKFYRRMNLAREELNRSDEMKPIDHLLSLYNHASRVQNLFSTIKGQDGDCDELLKQIQSRTLFLLLSINENDSIPMENPAIESVKVPEKEVTRFRRQHSGWSKARTVLKLLQNLFQACIRFKKFFLERKEKNDVESLLNRSIDNFVYLDFYKSNDYNEKQTELDELKICLTKQYQRSLIRLMAYQLMKVFIEKLDRIEIILPYLRKEDVDWSYFEYIQSSNYQIKKQISENYYSIIKFLIPSVSKSSEINRNLFSLLNQSYQYLDILHISQNELLQNICEHCESNELRLNWLELYSLKLCEYADNDRTVFQTESKLIFNELKKFIEVESDDMDEPENLSEIKNKEYFVFLLRLMYFHRNVISICATNDYFEELLKIYRKNLSIMTRIFVIRLLRYIVPVLVDSSDGKTKSDIELFLNEILNSIGDKSTSTTIVSELIDFYRTIISIPSAWQSIATDLIYNSIKSHLNSSVSTIEKILFASLNILGGYIEPYRLGSIVQLKSSNDHSLGIIIEIKKQEETYLVELFDNKEQTSVSIDKLELQSEIFPLNVDESIIDLFGEFISIESSSLIVLELKRRIMKIFSCLLNNSKIIEKFMNKTYANTVAKLSRMEIEEQSCKTLKDLRVFNRDHLEQYYLSLNQCEIDEEKVEEKTNEWKATISDESILKALSIPVQGWKPYMSSSERENFKKGRLGREDICIVPLPRNCVKAEVIEECGVNHRYHGRVAPNYTTTDVAFPTFIVDNLQLTEGKWYYCVRLPLAGVVQIGWATNGFAPSGGSGVGDDRYSWSYDGSRDVLFYEQGFYGAFDDIRWKENDVCGCGIEINGGKTNIKYWLNGKFLGTAFEHNKPVLSSLITCDLLPNGPATSFFPSVTIQWTGDPVKSFELIVSPEDMQKCPLPDGYKPLLLPKCIETENSIVDHPSHAYLIGDNEDDYLLTKRKNSKLNLLQDFVNNKHLPMIFNIDDQHLVLPDKSQGFPLAINTQANSSVTISFDYEILSSDEQSEFSLLKFNSTKISWKVTDQKQSCIIIFHCQKRQLKVYTNDESEIFDVKESIDLSQLYLLPDLHIRMKNVAIWNYALSENQISRLLTYGLFYIANEFQQLKQYRKRVNQISFEHNQQEFIDESLLPFNESFLEESWQRKKEEVDIEDESQYFKNPYMVQLVGNETYLVLNKSNEDWTNYSFILEFSIPHYPKANEVITLITLNSNYDIYLNDEGQICFDNCHGSLNINRNEIIRLFVTVDEHNLRLYLSSRLEIELINNDNQYRIESDHLFLFKENNLRTNTTNEDTVRISLKSITYLNRSVTLDESNAPGIISPSFEIVGPSLIAMGHKKYWIEKVLKEYPWKDVPRILHEQTEIFKKIDNENDQMRYYKIFSKLNLSMKQIDLQKLIISSKFDTYEHILEFVQHICPYLNSSSDVSSLKIELHENWFTQSVQDFDVPQQLTDWFRQGSSKTETDDEDTIYQLYDISHSSAKKNFKSVKYSPPNLTDKQFVEVKYACESGLICVYARSTILKMLTIWSNEEKSLFPIEKFNDYSVIRLLSQSQTMNPIDLLIESILKRELTADRNERSLFNYLRTELMTQSIQFFIQPSQINENNANFILKIVNCFVKLLNEESQLIDLLFPSTLINLLFDLFILIPFHSVKIEILRLFTNLSRISEKNILNHQIEEFLFQFLIQLSSESLGVNEISRRKFETTVADLIFILMKKNRIDLVDVQSKLPGKIQDLFLLMEVIDAWLDLTKEKEFPEALLRRSNELTEQEYDLKQEDFHKSNRYFNSNIDKELIRYINTNRSLIDSMAELIANLPNESEPNPTFYKNYVALSLIPADCIQLRTKFIYLFNIFLQSSLSIIDLTLSPEQSYLTDRIRTMKYCILSTIKSFFFSLSLDKTEASYASEWTTVNFDTVKASVEANDNSENTWFYQAFHQLHSNAHRIFRQGNDQLWHSQFVGMHSTDQGGPYRDSITRICSDLCSTRLSLFILCPNGRMNNGLNRDCWMPNVYSPEKTIEKKIQQQYRFVGQLLGMAVRKKHYLELKFAPLVWKKLLNETITVEDIESIDMQSFRMINEMEKQIEQVESSGGVNDDFESIFSSIMSDLHFDVASSSGETFELIPGGSQIPITAQNFKKYCSAYRTYRLNEFNRQIELMQQGLFSVVPSYYLSLFTYNELEEAVCGKGQIDIELLKRNTSYGGDYTEESQVIERFWRVMSEMFTDEQRKLFLLFVWGRSTLPTSDNDFQTRFTISRLDGYGADLDQILPRAHTCFFTIDLPNYTTAEIMCERLNYAITNCSSIDGDGNMNEDATRTLFDAEEGDGDDDIDWFS